MRGTGPYRAGTDADSTREFGLSVGSVCRILLVTNTNPAEAIILSNGLEQSVASIAGDPENIPNASMSRKVSHTSFPILIVAHVCGTLAAQLHKTSGGIKRGMSTRGALFEVSRNRCRLLIGLCCLGVSGLWSPAAAMAERTFVVMVFDGFAPVYIENFPTPAFDQMAQEGAVAGAMDQAFPTVSLSGGVTLSTGCWPENHGVMSNLFLDPERGLYDHASDADWLLGCEHLHEAAERQGVETAALGWYGRYSSTRGALDSAGPAGETAYVDFPDDPGRLAQLVDLIERSPEDRPRLILAYFKGPDSAGHRYGLEAEETRAAVMAADTIVGSVLASIDAQPDGAEIQLLVTTDHGMVPVETLVNIQRILRRHEIPARAVSAGTSSFLYFDDPSEEVISDAIRKLSVYEAFDVVRPGEQPEQWHLGTGPRVGDLILSAHPPYFIEDADAWPVWVRWLAWIGPDYLPSSALLSATHGYPTGTPGVEGILFARGDAFAPGRLVDRVRAVDVHPTVLAVLGLEPGQPVDGEVEGRLLR